MKMSGLIRFISPTQESPSSLSCVACTYMSGTVVRVKAFLASQFNASHTRPLKTCGLTNRKTWRQFPDHRAGCITSDQEIFENCPRDTQPEEPRLCHSFC